MPLRPQLGAMLLALGALGLLVSTAPLEIRSGYPILKDVFINGKGPYRMLLDTGAQSTSVRPGVAELCDLRPIFAVELQDALGSRVVRGARAKRVSSAGLELEDVEVLITSPPELRLLGPLDGVLGQSFLAHTNYWIDYGSKAIHWDRDGELEARLEGEMREFTLVDSRPALRARIGGGAERDRRLVLDSGASHLILFGEASGAGGPATASVRSAQAEGRARLIRVESLSIGGHNWRGLDAGILDRQGAEEGGLFPAKLLRSFYVNNRKRLVLVGPRVSSPRASVPATQPARITGATDRTW